MKIIILFGVFTHALAYGHSGGTDSNGCHHNRKTGGYHCHKSDSAETFKVRKPASVIKEKNKKLKKEVKDV